MSDQSLAFPYAKAFLDLSISGKFLDSAFKDMEHVERIGRENPDFKTLLKNPLIPLFKKRNTVDQVFQNLQVATQKLLDLLITKERPGIIFAVAREFLRQYQEYQNIQVVEIVTAQVLSPSLEKEILQHLEVQLKGKIQLEKKVDPDAIGGIMIRIGDRRYDGTIRKSLLEVKNSLMENHFQNQY